MGKLRQWFRAWFDKQIEKSFQRKANKEFLKGQQKQQYENERYRDGKV